jgi:hypothetical protein
VAIGLCVVVTLVLGVAPDLIRDAIDNAVYASGL